MLNIQKDKCNAVSSTSKFHKTNCKKTNFRQVIGSK